MGSLVQLWSTLAVHWQPDGRVRQLQRWFDELWDMLTRRRRMPATVDVNCIVKAKVEEDLGVRSPARTIGNEFYSLPIRKLLEAVEIDIPVR